MRISILVAALAGVFAVNAFAAAPVTPTPVAAQPTTAPSPTVSPHVAGKHAAATATKPAQHRKHHGKHHQKADTTATPPTR